MKRIFDKRLKRRGLTGKQRKKIRDPYKREQSGYVDRDEVSKVLKTIFKLNQNTTLIAIGSLRPHKAREY